MPEIDPTKNVRELIEASITRLDDIHRLDIARLDQKINDKDTQYQIQFNGSEKAVGTAFIAQEKAISAALIGTKEAIKESKDNTDKRFDLLSEKIDTLSTSMNKTSGERGIYVTHTDLSIAMDKLQTGIEATLRPVVTFMNSSSGQSKGLNMSWLYLVQAVGFLSVIVSVFYALSK